MVIQMTRAEYEAKYGVKPPVATSTPVQMTRAQYEAKYGAPPTASTTPPAAQNGLFSRIKSATQQSYQDRTQNIATARSKADAGQQTHAEGVLQSTGQVAGLIGDTTFNAAKETVRSIAPSAIPAVKNTLGAALQSKPAQAVMGAYEGFKENNPRAAANIEAVGNIASVIPIAKGGQVAGKVAGKAVLEGTEAASKATIATGKAIKNTPAKLGEVLSNVPADDFKFAADPKYTPMVEKAVKHVAENEKQPFFELANRTAMGINKADETAAQQLQQAKLAFKSAEPTATFDVRPYKTELAAQLQTFKEYGLELAGEKNFKLKKTAQSPFTDRELAALNGLLGKINASGQVDIDNLLALSKSLNAAYDEIPLGVNGTPRPYHALVMAIKQPTEGFIDNILPQNLKAAFNQYRVVQDMKSEIGNKLIDGQGNLKDTAEQFLSNVGNTNKGNVRLNADQIRALTGIDINNEVRAVKVAQKFSNTFPTTGSRTQDVVRSIVATGLGTVALGPVGTVAAVAATSPKLLGNIALKVGKSRTDGAAKKMGEYLKDVQPGLSTKDITQDKLDDLKDYLIQELDKAGRTLHLVAEQEATEFLKYLKEIKRITVTDVHRAMELLRLQGKPEAIETLRRELGATTEQPRDKLGQWIRKKRQ